MICVPVDREALLAEARSRVTRRRDIGQAFERLGPAGAELALCLDAAFDCVHALARPAATVLPLRLRSLERELGIEHEIQAPGGGGAPAQAIGFVYLLGCGYDSRDAFRRLHGDYTSHHFQDAIARELVFALGREVSRWLRRQRPDWRFVRQVLRGGRACRLLRRFDGAPPHVRANAAGALVPLHSVLGWMLGTPGGAPSEEPPADPAQPSAATASPE